MPSVLLKQQLPACLRVRDRAFTWAETRSMLYVGAWQRSLTRNTYRGRVVLFDHGPVYRLAVLREFGPRVVNDAGFRRWWRHAMDVWSQKLDLVVWLDAPNEELMQRIIHRSQSHACKSLGQLEAYSLLDRYRQALGETLSAMQHTRQLKILRIASNQMAPEQILHAVIDELPVAGSTEQSDKQMTAQQRQGC